MNLSAALQEHFGFTGFRPGQEEACTAALGGRDVLVVEDIVDSGLTLKYLLRTLSARNPSTLEVCALLEKPERRKVDLEIRYTGFEIPNCFVIGYGLDHGERFRNLPYVAALNQNGPAAE